MPVVIRDSFVLRIGKADNLGGSQIRKFSLKYFDLVNSTLRGFACRNLCCIIPGV